MQIVVFLGQRIHLLGFIFTSCHKLSVTPKTERADVGASCAGVNAGQSLLSEVSPLELSHKVESLFLFLQDI